MIVMDTGTIKLGAKKELSRKPLPSVLLEGFFYAEWTGLLDQPARGSVLASRVQEKEHSRKCQTPLAILSRKSVKPTQWPQEHTLCAPNFNFYDIPSSKRDVRGTNNLHTGATLSGVGEGQRLRKGFHSACKPRRLVKEYLSTRERLVALGSWPRVNLNLTPFESLSSAAEIRL